MITRAQKIEKADEFLAWVETWVSPMAVKLMLVAVVMALGFTLFGHADKPAPSMIGVLFSTGP